MSKRTWLTTEEWADLEAKGRTYVPGQTAVGKLLKCPQLKEPDHINALSVNKRVNYTLRLYDYYDQLSAQFVTKHEKKTSAQLSEVVSRLRRAGMLVNVGRADGEGLISQLTGSGTTLILDIDRDLSSGLVLRGAHPPFVPPR